MHYLKSDDKWKSNDGQDWDIPRLIKEELAQPIVGAACGGTHRMTGFSYAVRKREQRGEPFDGQWLRAKKFVDDYHEYTFKLQNPDGSFSTDWFAGRADYGPPSRRLETTGHITEWLAFSLNKEQLVEPRMIKSVSYLTNLLHRAPQRKMGHRPARPRPARPGHLRRARLRRQPGKRAEQLALVKRKWPEEDRREERLGRNGPGRETDAQDRSGRAVAQPGQRSPGAGTTLRKSKVRVHVQRCTPKHDSFREAGTVDGRRRKSLPRPSLHQNRPGRR